MRKTKKLIIEIIEFGCIVGYVLFPIVVPIGFAIIMGITVGKVMPDLNTLPPGMYTP